MIYKYIYKTPNNFSNIVMCSDGEYLTGLWFETAQDVLNNTQNYIEKDLLIFQETKRWLDLYFSGIKPDFTIQYKIENLTLFRKDVIEVMNSIEYGETLTYGEIAKIIANKRGLKRMSSQAVGKAVGFNPISIIIPCHRVIGANGNLTGYGGGIKNKIALLAHEKNDISKYRLPKK